MNNRPRDPKNRVLYLSQWFWPEHSRRGIEVAQTLTGDGVDVEVLTGFPNYPGGELYDGYRLRPYSREVVDGLLVHRVFLVPSHSRSSAGRTLNYLSFFVSALIFLLLMGRRYDAIYVYHPPITVGLAAAIAKGVIQVPYVLEVQDLWPDSIRASGMRGTKFLGSLVSPVCRMVYSRASRVLCQSVGMAERMIATEVSGDRVSVLYNWADEEYATPIGPGLRGSELNGEFNIVFGGTFGTVQGLDSVIRAAAMAKREVPGLHVSLIGGGVEDEALRALATRTENTAVTFYDAVPQSEVGRYFREADALLVHLKRDALFELTIPSKLQFYMAMGKPILAGLQGEAAGIVIEAGAGVVVAPGSVRELASAMVALAHTPTEELQAMGHRARLAYEQRFSFAAGMETIRGALQETLDET